MGPLRGRLLKEAAVPGASTVHPRGWALRDHTSGKPRSRTRFSVEGRGSGRQGAPWQGHGQGETEGTSSELCVGQQWPGGGASTQAPVGQPQEQRGPLRATHTQHLPSAAPVRTPRNAAHTAASASEACVSWVLGRQSRTPCETPGTGQ